MTIQIESLISLDNNNLKLDSSCIGKSLDFEYLGYKSRIIFPSFKYIDSELFPPNDFTSTYDKSVIISWAEKRKGMGYVYSLKKDNPLEFSCFSVLVVSNQTINEHNKKLYYESLFSWKERFIKWTEVLLYEDLTYEPFEESKQRNFEIESYITDGKKRPIALFDKDEAINITIGREKPLKYKDIEKTLSMCANEVPEYYNYLIYGLKSFNNKDYRHCVLNCATALEIAYAEVFNDHRCANTIPTTTVDYLYKKWEDSGIGYKVGVLNALGENISKKKVNKVVSNLRNSAIHAGVVISESDAKKCLDFVKKYLYKRLPL